MNVEFIAKTAHELNKAYCESIGDNSQPTWEEAQDWQKSSAIDGVKFHLANPDATPEKTHESWLKQKTEEGWKHGPVKNAETKEHPCFVPYEELPVSQKAKDYIFRQTIHSLKVLLPTVGTDGKLTKGGYRVGVSFNPGGHPWVNIFKAKSADLIDFMQGVMDGDANPEAKRCAAIAQTEIESAAMWAVKAITKPAN